MDLLLDTCAFIWWDSGGGLSSVATGNGSAHSLGHFWQLHWSYPQLPLALAGGSAPAHPNCARLAGVSSWMPCSLQMEAMG